MTPPTVPHRSGDRSRPWFSVAVLVAVFGLVQAEPAGAVSPTYNERGRALTAKYLSDFDYALPPDPGDGDDALRRGYLIELAWIAGCKAGMATPAQARKSRSELVDVYGEKTVGLFFDSPPGFACYQVGLLLDPNYTAEPTTGPAPQPKYPRDDALSFQYIALGCLHGDAKSCGMLSYKFEHGFTWGGRVQKDPTAAQEASAIACILGYRLHCAP